MLSDSDRREAADSLVSAERDRAPIPPLSERWPEMTVADAYEIQLLNIGRRVDAGGTIRGQKVGLTAKVMQEMLGVNEPDYGHLLDDMFILDGAEVPALDYCFPRVEVEVAFVLAAPLTGPDCTIDAVLAATDRIVPSIELIDSRIADWRIKLEDTIADNASSAGVVLGTPLPGAQDLDLTAIPATLIIDDEVVAVGASDAVLGNPALAVAWVANKLYEYGVTLEAGYVVIPGSCTKAVDVRAGNHVRASFDGLGSVSVNFT